VYFQLRNKYMNGTWVKVVEMGVEGDGNDALLRNFGVNIQEVAKCWEVMEGDEFEYPKRKGFTVTPPEWTPKGLSSKTIRVVYPVLLASGREEYLISERDSVKVNLLAHVRQNLLNETFGIVTKKNDATAEQKALIKAKKEEILAPLRACETVDDMLKVEAAKPYMSAAWLDNPEAMIVRKMRNNAIKRFPKSLNTIANTSLLQMDEVYKTSREEIEEQENSVPFEVDEEVDFSE